MHQKRIPELSVGLVGCDESANTKPALFWVLVIASLWTLAWLFTFSILAQARSVSLWAVLIVLVVGNFVLVFLMPTVAFLTYAQSTSKYQSLVARSKFYITTSHTMTVQLAVVGITFIAFLQLLILWQFTLHFGGECCRVKLEFDDEPTAAQVSYWFVMYTNSILSVFILLLVAMGLSSVVNPECWIRASKTITREIIPGYNINTH